MNKRAKKKVEKQIRAKMHKTLDYVLDINGVYSRKRDITGNLPTAFFRFYGHTAEVDVDIHANGWETGGSATYGYSNYTDIPSRDLGKLLKYLERVKEELCSKA